MSLNKIHKLEQTIVNFLNFDGWDLKWTGEGSKHYDASGFTQKGFSCVIEMKFRNKYYSEKMLEKFKYDALMNMNKDIITGYKSPTIIHAPAQSHLIQTLETEIQTLVIWVDRNSEDVIASEDKIYPHIYPGKPKVKHYKIAGKPIMSWHDRCFENEEKPKYLEMFPKHEEKIKSFDRNVHMKKWVWENIQRDKMEVDFVEVKYESLKDLDEFVPKEKRKDWTLKQVRVNGVNAYHN